MFVYLRLDLSAKATTVTTFSGLYIFLVYRGGKVMAVNGTKLTCKSRRSMSACCVRADITTRGCQFRF